MPAYIASPVVQSIYCIASDKKRGKRIQYHRPCWFMIQNCTIYIVVGRLYMWGIWFYIDFVSFLRHRFISSAGSKCGVAIPKTWLQPFHFYDSSRERTFTTKLMTSRRTTFWESWAGVNKELNDIRIWFNLDPSCQRLNSWKFTCKGPQPSGEEPLAWIGNKAPSMISPSWRLTTWTEPDMTHKHKRRKMGSTCVVFRETFIISIFIEYCFFFLFFSS